MNPCAWDASQRKAPGSLRHSGEVGDRKLGPKIKLFVVLEANLELADRFIGCLQSINAVPAKIVRTFLQVGAGAAQRGKRITNLGMGLRSRSSGWRWRRMRSRGNSNRECQSENRDWQCQQS